MGDRYGERVAELLAPIDVPTFLARFWEQRALFIPGPRTKFDQLSFGVDTLRQLLDEGPSGQLKAQYFDRKRAHAEVEITPDQAPALFDAGMTICLSSLEADHPPFESLAVACKVLLSLAEAFDVSCYWSPAGAGFGAHFDRQSIMVVQLDGTKRWRYGPTPAVFAPGKNFLVTADAGEQFPQAFPWFAGEPPLPRADQLVEQLLTPGDLLYLPAGTWHGTRAGDRSLALTLTFFHRTFASLLPGLLEELLGHDAGWRASLPLALPGETPPSDLPPSLRGFLADRLAQLQALVGTLEPEDLAHLWRAEVARFRFPLRPHPGATGGVSKVKRDDAFVIPLPVHYAAPRRGSGSGRLHVFSGGRHLTLPPEARSFVEHLARHPNFTARQALRWSDPEAELPWAEVRAALEAFLEVGLIVRADAGRGRPW